MTRFSSTSLILTFAIILELWKIMRNDPPDKAAVWGRAELNRSPLFDKAITLGVEIGLVCWL